MKGWQQDPHLPQEYYPLSYNSQVNLDLQSCFQQVIRSLLYIILDIAYAVTALSWHAAKPSQEHLDCQYLFGTHFSSLIIDGASQAGLIAFTNSDWAYDPIALRQAGLSN